MARRMRWRRRRRSRVVLSAALAAAALGVTGYWVFLRAPAAPTGPIVAVRPALTSDRPFDAPTTDGAEVTERGEAGDAAANDDDAVVGGPDGGDAQRVRQLLAAGREQAAAQKWIVARQYLSEAMALGIERSELTEVRAELTRIGDETIFSSRLYDDDPLTERYIVQVGDTLGKIAKRYSITAELLAGINGIRNVNLIRQGQTLKVIHGPFHARVDRSAFTLDVYLQDTFVRAYRVGLGADDGTPTGTWKVRDKLTNPTYYPPRGGQIVAADDPKNPLGERWIGLEGVSGQALGQQRYGIHGTIEPDSVGRSVSLGCIRMHNADVEFFYDLVIPELSTIDVK